jgi:UDP-N-acetyl-D-glucosamine dehydrogenase
MTQAQVLRQKITDRKVVVGVVGLGYVGLPLVREFCNSGIRVIGFDIDTRKVRMLKAGQTYIEHLPGGFFKDLIQRRLFRPTADMNELSKPDAILIAVPTCRTSRARPGTSPSVCGRGS